MHGIYVKRKTVAYCMHIVIQFVEGAVDWWWIQIGRKVLNIPRGDHIGDWSRTADKFCASLALIHIEVERVIVLETGLD